MITLREAADHENCTLTACLDPLHKGPCKGWKGGLRTADSSIGKTAKDASGEAHQAGKAVGRAAPIGEKLKPGTPGTITTPSGKVYQKVGPSKAAPAARPSALKPGTPGTITTPSGKVYQKVGPAAPVQHKPVQKSAPSKPGKKVTLAQVAKHAARVKAAQTRLAEATAKLKAHQAKHIP